MNKYQESSANKSFKLGRLVITLGVNSLIADDIAFSGFVIHSVKRHMREDWGNLCDEDKKLNDQALERQDGKLGERLFSAYEDKVQPKIWIITEWDESVTTVLFPDEY